MDYQLKFDICNGSIGVKMDDGIESRVVQLERVTEDLRRDFNSLQDRLFSSPSRSTRGKLRVSDLEKSGIEDSVLKKKKIVAEPIEDGTSVVDVLHTYEEELTSVFLHYCFVWNPLKSAETLDMRGFKHFVKDIRIAHSTSFNNFANFDLLFSRVCKVEAKVLMSPGRGELDRDGFDTLLVELCNYVLDEYELSPGKKVDIFIREHVIKYSEKDESLREFAEMENEGVVELLRKWRGEFHEIFDFYSSHFFVTERNKRGKELNLKAFVSCLRYYGFLGMIEKKKIRKIFMRYGRVVEGERLIEFDDFVKVMCIVGLVVYGGSMYREIYDTAEKKVEKLVSKITLLKKRKQKDIRGN